MANCMSLVAISRPEGSIVGHLQRLRPFEMAAEDAWNTADLRVYCLQVFASVSD
jgi:hypothetical protein